MVFAVEIPFDDLGRRPPRLPSNSSDEGMELEMENIDCDSQEELLTPAAPKISNLHKINQPVSIDINKLEGILEFAAFDVIEFDQCSELKNVIDLLKNSNIQQSFERRESLKPIGLIFKIDQDLTDTEFSKMFSRKRRRYVETLSNQLENFANGNLNDLSLNSLFNHSHKLLIAIQLTYTGKCKIFWKTAKENDFVCLSLMNFPCTDKSRMNEVVNYISEFIMHELQNGKTGLMSDRSVTNVSIDALGDSSGNNLLMIAVMESNQPVVSELLKCHFNIDHMSKDDKLAVDIAWDYKYQDIVLDLLKANSQFPENYNWQEASLKVREFVIEMREMQNAIKVNSEETVMSYVQRNKNLRHFYSEQNISAPLFALKKHKISIYQVLIDNHVFTSPTEKIEDLKNFTDLEKEILKSVHEGNLNVPPLLEGEHLTLLRTNSRFAHDEPDVTSKRDTLKEAFEFLNQFYFVRIILLLIAKSRNFKIVFDFQRSSINFLDPTLECITRGYYCSSGTIYVAAKEFLDESKRLKGYGTLIHELTHYAMNLAYSNKCRPYSKDESVNKKAFEEIRDDCEILQDYEELIHEVFDNYESKSQHQSELIARAPQLLVKYSENRDQLIFVKEKYASLFKYFEKMIKDLETKKIRETEEKGKEYVKKYMEKAKKQKRTNSILKKVLIAIAIIFVLLVLFVPKHIEEKTINEICSDCIYENLPQEIKNHVEETIVRFQGVEVRLKELDPQKSFLYNLTLGEIATIRYSGNFKIGQNFLDTKDFKSKHCVDFNFKQGINSYYLKNLHEIIETMITLLITGQAGTGKSTTLRRAVLDLISQNSLKLIIFIKASEYETQLKDLKENDIDLDEIFDFILKTFIEKSTVFETELYKHKLRNNETVFFWDGLDELSGKSQNNALMIIKKLKSISNNHQWISSRHITHLSLEESLGTKPFLLQPLDSNKDETEKFKNCYIESTYPENQNELKQNVTKVLSTIQQNGGLIDKRLIIKMLVDLVRDLNKTETNSDLSIHYNIYDTLIVNKVKYSSIFETVCGAWEFHYYHALKIVLKGIYFDILNQNYVKVQKDETQTKKIQNFYQITGTITIDDLPIMKKYEFYQKSGIDLSFSKVIHYKSDGSIIFPHRTYAEYLVAKYLNQRLYHEPNDGTNSNVDLRILIFIASHEDFNFTRNLLLESIKNKPYLSVSVYIENEMIDSFSNIFEIFGFDTKVVSFLSKIFFNNPRVIEALWKTDQTETAFNAFLRVNYISLPHRLSDMVNIMKETFSDNSTKIMHGKNQELCILSLIWYHNDINFTTDILNATGMKIYQNFTEAIVRCKNFPEFFEYVEPRLITEDKANVQKEFISNYFIPIFSMYVDTKNESIEVWERIEKLFNHSEIADLFNRKTLSNRSFLSDFVYLNKDIDYLKFTLLKMKNYLKQSQINDLILLQDSDLNYTALTYVTWKGISVEILNFYWQFISDQFYNDTKTLKEHLKAESIYHLNALHMSAWNEKDDNFFNRTFQIYNETFSKVELQKIMFGERKSSDKLFLRSLVNTAKKNVCQFVMNLIEELFIDNVSHLRNILIENEVLNAEILCDHNTNE